MPGNYCTTRDAAALLGVSLRTAQQWLEKGVLEGWKTAGGHRRITRASIDRALAEKLPGTGLPRQGGALPILIIEDDAALLKLYRAQIERWPFATTIFTAPNGYEGLVMIGETSPRLLICDLRLPGVNGFQIVRALRAIERYRNLAIVVVSGMPFEEIDAHGGMPADIELMGKPIDFKRLQGVGQALWQELAAGRRQLGANR